MNLIYSTLSCPCEYVLYSKNTDITHLVKWKKLIKGNANVVQKAGEPASLANVTEVTDEELENLNKIPQFKSHIDRGFIIVLDKREKLERVAADLKKDIKSSQMDQNRLNELQKENKEAQGVQVFDKAIDIT